MTSHHRSIRSGRGQGFTLVEILIVVIILGILAAIVIPQFTNASTSARQSNLTSQLQTLRSQIELYKLDHNDNVPDLVGQQFNQLTAVTDVTGSTTPAANAKTYGPYLQAVPINPLTNSSTVVNVGTSAAATTGWYYESSGAALPGTIHGATLTGAQSDTGE